MFPSDPRGETADDSPKYIYMYVHHTTSFTSRRLAKYCTVKLTTYQTFPLLIMTLNRNNAHAIAAMCINTGNTHHPNFPPSRIRFLSNTFPNSKHCPAHKVVAVHSNVDEEISKTIATINKIDSPEIN